MKAKVTNAQEDLVRDLNSKAVMNNDSLALQKAKQKKRINQKKEHEMKTMREEIKELKAMVKTLMDEREES